jgi:putative Mg2+ transporter-C (MgtC) family protein
MSVLSQVGQSLADEFALPSVGDATMLIARLTTAAVLGGLLGYERESKGRSAGLKTHILVSLGSALFVLAPIQAGVAPAELTRVMQGIVSGIGFLGAGAILKTGKGDRVEGVTTAAGIWMTAAIGMAAGMGLELVALMTTAFALAVFWVMPRLVRGEGNGGQAHDGEPGIDRRDGGSPR